MNYHNQKIAVVGLGISGVSVAHFLLKKGAIVTLFDAKKTTQDLPKELSNTKLFTGAFADYNFKAFDMIVLSPGITQRQPCFEQAKEQGVEIVGDIELFCLETDKDIIAITGSNGKTTVTSLVYEIAKTEGIKVALGGNIGTPVLDLIEQDYDLFVLELSSFQLETTSHLKAKASVVLNISDDHLDRYNDLEDYAQTKRTIYDNSETAIYNIDDVRTYTDNEKKVSFGNENGDYHIKNDFLCYKNEPILNTQEMSLQGVHNQLNALAAMALARCVGISFSSINKTLCNFKGLSHRFELVETNDGIKWINDSKATNVGATLAALQGLQVTGTLYLLLGGDGKGADFTKLSFYLKQDFIMPLCFGKDGQKIAKLSNKAHCFETMQQAIESIQDNLKTGDWVLLSPACASLDQFKNFEQRGDIFKEIALNNK